MSAWKTVVAAEVQRSGLVSMLLAEIKGLADGFIVGEGKEETGF